MSMKKSKEQPWLSPEEQHYFSEGTFYKSFEKLGAHLVEQDGKRGVRFSVWAPNASSVSVVGDFNDWDERRNNLEPFYSTGIWVGFVPELQQGEIYKFALHSANNGYSVFKADPCAFFAEIPPRTGSVVWDLKGYEWQDSSWMKNRGEKHKVNSPISIYEMHLGSWRRKPEDENRYLTYRELAAELPEYVRELGFTHVEFLPVAEHPFDGSWGYQLTGYFAPSSRFGTPQDFMYLVDCLHQAGIGVIVDWVPGHFPTDQHGLGYFDGTHLYEHADYKQGFHPDWQTLIFNYGRTEVANFLIANALFWFEKYHIDGLRVDAVASMLYLDYSRKEGEWIPNGFGGRENLEAIDFLKRFNEVVYREFPDTLTIAEESTAWPMVSRPTYLGGLGFGYKWNMGWMNDVLSYFHKDPVHRSYCHNNLTFGLLYAFHENFVLPLSHDEVVHGKGSLISKMPGDDWQKFANLRTLFGYMYGHPGKKLLFMGGEFGQWGEWNSSQSLDWHQLEHDNHRGIQNWVKDLNQFYQNNPALYEVDFEHKGFSWVDCHDHQQSVLTFLRFDSTSKNIILVVCNFTPVPRYNHRLGVSRGGYWKEALNSDSKLYWGSDLGNCGGAMAEETPWHGHPFSISITVPPLSCMFFVSSKE
jgi:1,4-alpha-glucan branching enzyme